jgi:hypothetical protein
MVVSLINKSIIIKKFKTILEIYIFCIIVPFPQSTIYIFPENTDQTQY